MASDLPFHVKCASCGKFVSIASMADGSAKFRFEPDSYLGPEIEEWICAKRALVNQQSTEKP